jgi:hypothetical protein
MRKIKTIIASALIFGSIGFFLGSIVTVTEGVAKANYVVNGYKYTIVEINGQQVVVDGWKTLNKPVKFYSF